MFFGLEFAIKYCERKKNPADSFLQRPDYMDKDNNLSVHIVSYVTRSITRCVIAQEVFEKGDQAPKKSKANIEPDISESLLDNSSSLNLIVDSTNALPESKSTVSRTNLQDLTKKVSRKQK